MYMSFISACWKDLVRVSKSVVSSDGVQRKNLCEIAEELAEPAVYGQTLLGEIVCCSCSIRAIMNMTNMLKRALTLSSNTNDHETCSTSFFWIMFPCFFGEEM